MTTLRLQGPATAADEPGGGGFRPHWISRGWGDEGERAGRGWLALAWVVVLTALVAQDAGRMTFDTKLGVNIDPVGFYQRLWHLWNPLEWFGGLQDQYIGYAFPMGVYYLVAHLVRLPVWLAERLWMSLLVAAGFWGLVRLAERVGIGTRPTRLLAAAAFALWPTFTILVGSTSAAVLPGLLAPWAVLPLAGSRTARAAAARSGLVVLCMGGVNAVCTLTAILLPGMYILTRARGRRWRLAAWWSGAVLLAGFWWLVPLLYQGRYGFNFLPYIEQSANTTQTMSAAAVLRGSGNWVAYMEFGRPWLPAGWIMVSSAWAVAAGTLAAAVGLAGLACRDVPEGTWLRWTAGLAALWALSGYTGPLGGLFHVRVAALLDGPLSPLRNVYKVEPVLATVLALGIAHVLAKGAWRLPVARRGTVAVAVVVLGGLGLPYLGGRVLQPGSFPQVPAYWRQAAAFLHAHAPAETALVVPADSHAAYTWGQPIDEPLEPLARSPWVQRDLVPFSGGGVRDLLNGAEQAIEAGAPSLGLAAYLSRAGVRYVVVRNDLDPAQLDYTPPSLVHATLEGSGFTRAAAFGPPVAAARLGGRTGPQFQATTSLYPAVEIFESTDSGSRPVGPAAVLPAGDTVLVTGGPAALLQLIGQGRLNAGRPAVIAGQSTGTGLPPAAEEVTDGLRRSDTVFGLPSHNTSFTYTATDVNPPDDPHGAAGESPRQLLPAGGMGHQTVAVLRGAARVTASSAGSWLWQLPQGDPVNAFDGDPSTSWIEGRPGTAVGQWVQVDFDRRLELAGPITVRLLDDVSRPVATRLVVTTDAGQAVTDTTATAVAQPLNVPTGTSSRLRITIAAAQGGTPGGPGAGISEVTIPGVRVTRFLQPAQDLAGPVPSFSFHRDTATTLGVPGTAEPALNRTFTTPVTGPLRFSATATAVPGAALDLLLDQLSRHTPPALRITAAGLATGVLTHGTRFKLPCGQGPVVTVDGHAHSTSAVGTVGDLTAMRPVKVLLCARGETVTLPAGRHWLTSPGSGTPLAVTDLSLAAPGPVPAGTPSRDLRIGSWGAERRTIRIGPGVMSYLEVHQAANPGWIGTLNGHRLPPVTLDGWQQGFVVPTGQGGTVTLSFAPADGYHALLAGAGLAVLGLVVMAFLPSRRPRPPQPEPVTAPSGDALLLRGWLARGATVLLLTVVGGPLGLAVPAVALLGSLRPRWVPWLAFTSMTLAGVLIVADSYHGTQPGAGAFGAQAQAAALTALAAALTPLPVRPSRRAGRRLALRQRFTAVEELDHYLERADEPNIVHLETHLRGRLDVAALHAAITRVLAATPEARRRRGTGSRWARRLVWEIPSATDTELVLGRPVVVGWADETELDALRERLFAWPLRIDEATLRVVAAIGPDHDVVILQTHHAAFDGIAGLALLRSIAAAYRARAGTVSAAPNPCCDVVPALGVGPTPGSRPARRGVSAVTRLAPDGGRTGLPGYGFTLRSFDVPQVPGSPSESRATVNDLLVAALFLAVQRWNVAHDRRSGLIRVTVPVNDRPPQSRWDGYGNLSRLVRVTTRPAQRIQPDHLLGVVAAQTRIGKLGGRSGTDSASRALAGGWAPAGVKGHAVRGLRRFAGPLIADTSLVTNLGAIPDPPSFSGAGDEPLWFSTPAPMPRGLSIGVATVGGRLRLCVRYRHTLMDQAAADDFATCYQQALAELGSAEAGRRPPP